MRYLSTAIALVLLAAPASANNFHPDFLLRDSAGELWQSGEAASQTHTCGQCHHSDYIQHSLDEHHMFVAANQSRVLRQLNIGGEDQQQNEIGCLDCHTSNNNQTLESLANSAGIVSSEQLLLTRPTSEACGHCHGLVNTTSEPVHLGNTLQTLSPFSLTGEIFSGQPISHSALNIANKGSLHFSFDAHAERVLACADCHGSANNPVAPQKTDTAKHLKFDPRTLSAHDYLQQPNHNFTKAHACSDCHETEGTHTWLPYLNQHLSKLSCESCHSNWIAAPALTSVYFDGDQLNTEWKGMQDGFITGYTPKLLPNKHGKLTPFNVIAVNTGDATYTIAKPIHHNINRENATQNCLDCHNKQSHLLADIQEHPANLSLPQNFIQGNTVNLAAAGIYVLGGDTLPWIDWLGLGLLLATVLGVSGHGFARYLANRRLGAHTVPRKRMYMYSYYQRLWHWLQAAAILLLLATGAAIHKPWLFTWLSFSYMVEIHNILGFVLFVNAALALFYHLASGEIKQFIPMPADLFVRSFEQIQFYAKGIFNHEPHPFAKIPEQKLNPLQKVAYFGLLNVLLPAQMFTGLLMWGAQNWPAFSNTLGGLTVLGPLHSLLAWAFAAFLIMHIYLTTTSGPKPMSGIKAMIDGWEDVEINKTKE